MLGDLWYFPSGHPHSLQGLSANGTEFLLVFDDGNFSEDSTFLLTDWLAHTPLSVLGENFRVHPEVFKAIPKTEKYIFQGSNPDSIDKEIPKGQGYKKSKLNFTHRMLEQEPVNATGGHVRITDSTNFPISKTVAAAHLDIQPGGRSSSKVGHASLFSLLRVLHGPSTIKLEMSVSCPATWVTSSRT
jgi:oxalate decarboxylase family bicupin protein